MRLRFLLLLVLSLPTFAPAVSAQAGPAPVEARGPDADGAFLLVYRPDVEPDAPARLSLHVRREDGAGVVESGRDLGVHRFASRDATFEVSFLPAHGPGDYAAALVADGLRGAALVFRVEEGGGSADFSFTVADEPTELRLANDSVNADGKSKLPGEAVLTRAVVRDGNGLADLTGMRRRVEREDGTLVAEDPVALAPSSDGVEAAIESSFARAPLAAGTYRVTLLALKGDATAASVSRTFVVRDVAPVLAGGNLSAAIAGRATRLETSAVVADRNGAPDLRTLEARVYRGSTRMEGAGFSVALVAPRPAPDVDGHGRSEVDVRVSVPANATPALHRVSLHLDGTLVGSLPFEVRKAPALTEARVEAAPGGALRWVALGSGKGVLQVEAVGSSGARLRAEGGFDAGAGEVVLNVTGLSPPLAWELSLLAQAGEAPVEARNGTWTPEGAAPLRLVPRQASPRLPASWKVETPGRNVADARASVEIRRWDGVVDATFRARLDGDALRVHARPDVEAGRYDARLTLAWPDGARGEASWSFEAGPWTSVGLGAVNVSGREARIPVRNDGGLAVRRLVVEVAPDVAEARLVVDGRAFEPRPGARRVFSGFELPPGASAELVLRLPEGPMPSGARAASVRVLAMGGGP